MQIKKYLRHTISVEPVYVRIDDCCITVNNLLEKVSDDKSISVLYVLYAIIYYSVNV